MEFENYINGKWVKGKGTFQTINPANEELVAEIAQAEIPDVDAAVNAATEAFKSWRLMPAPLAAKCSSKLVIFSNRKRKNSRSC
jgi:acyl-CoA reductase-like NAD-dependent aldehyde dehydrogenase